MLKDYFKFALGNITERKLRSSLTVLGIIIGIMFIVFLVSLGQGFQNMVQDQFEKVGRDRILVSPGREAGGTPASAALAASTLTEDDVEVIEKVQGVRFADGVITSNFQVKYEKQIKYFPVFAIPLDNEAVRSLRKIEFFDIQTGKYLTPSDQYKAMIGPTLAKDGFEEELSVGDNLIINNQTFEIAAIHKESGNPVHDAKITIPRDIMEEFNVSKGYSLIPVEVDDNYDITEVGNEIREELRESRGVEKGEEDFTAQTSEQLVKSFQTVLTMVQGILLGISAISLLVGGIGIISSMYTSVLERTKDIGIMKSIGAQNKDIFLIFLLESGIMGVGGGMIGVILGLSLSKLVEILAMQQGFEMLDAYISLELILGALAFSFLVGAISGLLPARRASKMKPIEALKY